MIRFSVRRLGSIVPVALGLMASKAPAGSITLYNDPPPTTHQPDESQARGVLGDAPVGFGPDSWQNVANSPGAKKVNAYVTPEELFGHAVTINDIPSITYYTKAPAAQENWFVNIYTKTTGAGDEAGFYHQRFFNDNYTGYASDSAWHNNAFTTVTKSSGVPGPSQTLANWKTTFGSQSILFFSPQTNSALNGNNAQIDGLVVTLTNAEVGSVNFAVVPLPATVWMGMALMTGLVCFQGYKRYSSSHLALA